MSVSISNHFYQRYVERIEGITDDKEMKQYIVVNKEILTKKITRLYENSQRIYKGQIGDNITRTYHIADNIILILNTTEDALITMYRVEFGFSEGINRGILKGLLDELKQCEEDRKEQEEKHGDYLDAKNLEKEQLKSKIKVVQDELKALQDRLNLVELDALSSMTLVSAANKRYENTANLICNSLEYKRELKALSN